MRMNASQLINQDSGNVEWYTKSWAIEAARTTMGSIDLDPASCAEANERVRAGRYFTKADNGLSPSWFGNVWMNHPFSDGEEPCKPNCQKKRCRDPKKRGHCITERIPSNAEWINKLINEYEAGNVNAACCICWASTSEAWFHPLLAYPVCLVNGRQGFIPGAGQKVSSPSKGLAIAYLGPRVDKFAAAFGRFGRIMVPYLVSGTLCATCERPFNAKRADTLYCSGACRQKAKRQKVR